MLQFGAPIEVSEVKAADDGWTVSGYASTFGNVDLGNDVVMPGAFTKALEGGSRVRFLHSHDPRMVLGVPLALKEDKTGLYGEFKISKTKLGEDTRELLRDGALDSFSIGYVPKEWEYEGKGDERVRQLKEVSLLEVSLVAIPMNPEAIVTGLKSWMDALEIDDTPTTIADKAKFLQEGFTDLVSDIRGLVDGIDRPLSQTKRRELADLLELCSEMDAVRSDLDTVLKAAPSTGIVEVRRLYFELAERRRRLAQAIGEPS